MSIFFDIDLKAVKGVLIDLDNTLYDYDPCHQHALKCCHEEFKNIENQASFSDFVLAYKDAQVAVKKILTCQAAGHSRLLYFQRLFEKKIGHTNIDLAVRFEELYWRSFYTKMSLRPGVEDFFKNCNSSGVIICLITDLSAKVQFEKIKFLKIDPYINFVVSSEEAGADKPGTAIFKLALEKAGLLPEQVIMIGDSYEKDVVGAAKLGMKTFLV